MRGRRFALPGRSAQTRTTSPGTRRRAASAMSASLSPTKTFPRSSAATAFPRDPRRSGAARNLSRRTPASAPPTIHCWPFVVTLRLIVHVARCHTLPRSPHDGHDDTMDTMCRVTQTRAPSGDLRELRGTFVRVSGQRSSSCPSCHRARRAGIVAACHRTPFESTFPIVPTRRTSPGRQPCQIAARLRTRLRPRWDHVRGPR